MNSYVTGFIEQAKKNGVADKEAMQILKAAAAADPNVAAQAGMQAGISAPGPESMGSGQPPLPTGGQGGLPPELEQLINSLPPEVLAQLLQEVEAELKGGASPEGAQGHEGAEGAEAAAMAPQGHQQKQGSEKDLILAKTAKYQEGFLEASRYYGVDLATTQNLYKSALEIMEKNPVDLSDTIDTNEKRAAHYEGFIKSAMTVGFSEKDATDIYKETFFN